MIFKSIFFLLFGAGLMSSCGVREAEVKYKIEVDVLVDNALFHGESVWKFKINSPTIGLATPYNGIFQAEAVPVKIDGGQYVFATLKNQRGESSYGPMLPERLFKGDDLSIPPKKDDGNHIKKIESISRNVGMWRDINCQSMHFECPLFVIFEDISNPESMHEVYASKSTILNKQINIQRVRVTIVGEKPSNNVTAILPWLRQLGRVRGTIILNPPRFLSEGKPIQFVAPTDFKTDLYR